MYKPKKVGTHWHAINKKGWTGLICEKKSTAKIVCSLLNDINFDEITDIKKAKLIHEQIADLARTYDRVLK